MLCGAPLEFALGPHSDRNLMPTFYLPAESDYSEGRERTSELGQILGTQSLLLWVPGPGGMPRVTVNQEQARPGALAFLLPDRAFMRTSRPQREGRLHVPQWAS